MVKSGTTSISQFGFSTWTTNDTTFYADAIGFSWDANYSIGENYNCGNLTDFYDYSSTKLDEFSPCLMNLPEDALKLIPWVRNYENSDQGKKPQNFNAYLEQWWASVWDDVQEEFQKLIDDLVIFFMENFPWAWLLIRAAILILIYIIFAFILLSIKIIFYGITQLLSLFQTVMDLDLTSSEDKISVEGDMQLNVGYEINYNYNNEFQFEYPSIDLFFESAGLIFNLIMDFYEIDLKINEFINNLIPPESIEYPCDLLSNVGTGMSIFGTSVGIQAGLLSFCGDEGKERIIFITSTSAFFIGFLIFLIIITKNGLEKIPSSTFLGLGIGFFIAGVVFFKTEMYLDGKKTHYKTGFLKKFGLYVRADTKMSASGLTINNLIILDFLLTLLGVPIKIEDLFSVDDIEENTSSVIAKTALSLIAGTLSLFLASYALINLAEKNRESKVIYSCLWGLISMLFAGIFISIGIDKLQNEY